MRRVLLFVALLAFALVGCGSGKARVKGRLVENGQALTFAPTSAAVELILLKEDGTPDRTKVTTAVVDTDGSFEVVASGGEVPPGTYVIGLKLPAPLQKKYAKLAAPASPIRRKVVTGSNDLTIDLAKPN
jgi:hypothetical protein